MKKKERERKRDKCKSNQPSKRHIKRLQLTAFNEMVFKSILNEFHQIFFILFFPFFIYK